MTGIEQRLMYKRSSTCLARDNVRSCKWKLALLYQSREPKSVCSQEGTYDSVNDFMDHSHRDISEEKTPDAV